MSQIVPVDTTPQQPARPLPPGLEKLQLQVLPPPNSGLDVVPWDERKDVVPGEKPGELSKEEWQLALEAALLICLAFVDIVLCLVVFFAVDGFKDKELYNIVDLRVILLPGIDIALLIFALLGFGFFAAIVVLVECWKKPWFHWIMGARLLLSAWPCACMNLALVFSAESHEWSPFAALVVILCSTLAWFVHMRLHYAQSVQCVVKVVLDIAWSVTLILLVILVLLYAFDGIEGITGSDSQNCPFADNQQMPVFTRITGEWFCVPWSDNAVGINRNPAGAALPIACTDTFITLFGGSIGAHAVTCPSECLGAWTGSITGCNIYTVDSPICIAAIHSGAITESGGEVTVLGRVGVSSFQQCSQNSVVSQSLPVMVENSIVNVFHWDGEGDVVAPTIVNQLGEQLPQAFHFNVGESREYVWLKDFERLPEGSEGIVEDEPWTRIEASVSVQIAGLELAQGVIKLGNTHSDVLSSADCRIELTGVRCDADPAALLKLDFCEPDTHTCPA